MPEVRRRAVLLARAHAQVRVLAGVARKDRQVEAASAVATAAAAAAAAAARRLKQRPRETLVGERRARPELLEDAALRAHRLLVAAVAGLAARAPEAQQVQVPHLVIVAEAPVGHQRARLRAGRRCGAGTRPPHVLAHEPARRRHGACLAEPRDFARRRGRGAAQVPPARTASDDERRRDAARLQQQQQQRVDSVRERARHLDDEHAAERLRADGGAPVPREDDARAGRLPHGCQQLLLAAPPRRQGAQEPDGLARPGGVRGKRVTRRGRRRRRQVPLQREQSMLGAIFAALGHCVGFITFTQAVCCQRALRFGQS